MRFASVLAAIGLAAAANLHQPIKAARLHRARSQRSAGSRRTSTLHKPNGVRECARRRAQIARGMLRVSK